MGFWGFGVISQKIVGYKYLWASFNQLSVQPESRVHVLRIIKPYLNYIPSKLVTSAETRFSSVPRKRQKRRPFYADVLDAASCEEPQMYDLSRYEQEE